MPNISALSLGERKNRMKPGEKFQLFLDQTKNHNQYIITKITKTMYMPTLIRFLSPNTKLDPLSTLIKMLSPNSWWSIL